MLIVHVVFKIIHLSGVVHVVRTFFLNVSRSRINKVRRTEFIFKLFWVIFCQFRLILIYRKTLRTATITTNFFTVTTNMVLYFPVKLTKNQVVYTLVGKDISEGRAYLKFSLLIRDFLLKIHNHEKFGVHPFILHEYRLFEYGFHLSP